MDNLLRRNEDLKEYFNSAYSSVEINDGRILQKEEKEFFDKMLHTIEENLANQELNVEMVSSLLGISTRQLYRKLKNVTEKTPNDIIREYRLTTVEKLLVSSNFSIDEIMYKAGFANRGNFFVVFAQRFGTTPKKYREMRKEEIE